MAFQTGSQVNAALGRTDYTPFLQGAMQGAQAQARGAENIAAGLAGLGQQVATGIEKYYKKQEEKGIEQQGVEFIKSNVPGIDDKAARAGLKAAGGAAAFVNFMNSQKQSQEAAKQKQEVDSLTEILRQGGGTIPSPISNQVAKSFSPSTLFAARKQFLEQSKMESEINKLNAESGVKQPEFGKVEIAETDPATGQTIVKVYDKNTRQLLSTYNKEPAVTIGAVAPGTVVTKTAKGWESKPIENAPPSEAEIKRTETVVSKEKAQENFGNHVRSAFANIMALNDMGAMVNPENDVMTNLKAKVGASTLGQSITGIQGSEIASIQQQLSQLKPLMIAEIKNSSGLSASQLSSNKELDFYLDAMADPKKDFYSNLAALDSLSKQIGGKDIVGELLQDKPEVLSRIRREANTLQARKPIKLDVKPTESVAPTTTPTVPKVRVYDRKTGTLK
jgi:hypothetical protein